MSKTYRQGDVLLQRVIKLPPYARHRLSDQEARIVLAYDQFTGHSTAVSTAFATFYIGQTDEERYIVTTLGARLVHESHPSIELAPGVYKVVEPVFAAHAPERAAVSMDSSDSNFPIRF
jgi:hypothetical protein